MIYTEHFSTQVAKTKTVGWKRPKHQNKSHISFSCHREEMRQHPDSNTQPHNCDCY